MKKEMLINVAQPEECRIAILEDGVLEELYVERTSHENYVGNIYKGKIVNIEPSIQAAFVDFGVGRNGFLHVSDVEPTYYRHLEPGGPRGRPEGRGDRFDRGDRRDRGDRSDRGDRGDRGDRRDRDRDRRPATDEWVRERDAPRPIQEEREPEPVRQETEPPLTPAPDDFAAGIDEFASGTEEDANDPWAMETLPPTVALLPGPVEEEERETSREFDPPSVREEQSTRQEPEPGQSMPATPAADPLVPRAPSAPLIALPDTRIEEDLGKPRRRSRGTTGPAKKRTSRQSSATQKGSESGTPAEKAESSGTPEQPSGGETPDDDGPRPRFMESAERRTSDKNNGPDAPHELGPISEGPQGSGSEMYYPPDAANEGSGAPASEDRPRGRGRSRQGGGGGRGAPRDRQRPERRGNVEADLAADLEAAEIEDEPDLPFSEPLEESFQPDLEEEDIGEGPAPGRDRGRRDDFEDEPFDRGRGQRDRRGPPPRGRGRGGPQQRDRMGRLGSNRPKPLIQDIFKRGQEVIVQVIKEGIGSKGPTLSTYISIPGRYLVLMPCLNRTGVSRKISDDDQRRRLREMFNELKPPRGLGFIMRTAAIDKNKRELQRDLVYLSRLWQVVVRRIKKLKSPAEIYQESDMIIRHIRDTFTSDIDTIWVDDRAAYEHAKEFLEVVMPRFADRLKLFEGREPLFSKNGIEEEIARIQQKKVPLAMGGSIVIEQTEALVAIDVNSGNFRADNNAEETAYQMNLQAAREIARQLRLRDLGGVIVNDFIDMRDEKHKRGVEIALRNAMKRDRARTKILKISQFGLIEMTRQRIRTSLKRSGYEDCPHCNGVGHVKNTESMSLEVMRILQLASCRDTVARVELSVPERVADYLLNRKRRELMQLEESGSFAVHIHAGHGVASEHLEYHCFDKNDNEVNLFPPEPVFRPRLR